MYKSKLVKLLGSLSPEEFKRLRKVFQSSFFTSNVHLDKLYLLLRRHYPAFEARGLSKKAVFEKLFPDTPYSDIKMRNLMREMTRMTEDFLIHCQLEQDTLRKGRILEEAYGQRKLERSFLKETKSLLRKLREAPYRDDQYYREVFELSFDQLRFATQQDKRRKYQIFNESEAALDHFYELKKLWFLCERKNMMSLYSLDGVTYGGKSHTKKEEENLLRYIFQRVLTLHEQEDDELFEEIHDRFFRQIEQIRMPMRQEIFLWLNNYLTRRMKQNDRLYIRQLFLLYKNAIEKGLFAQKDYLLDTFYLNIVVTAAKNGSYDWARTFIDQQSGFLQPATREDIKNLGEANLLFYEQQFDGVVYTLLYHQYVNPLHRRFSKVLLLRAYYELFIEDPTYYDPLVYQCLAFEKQLQREKDLQKKRLPAYRAFSGMIRKMAKKKTVHSLTAEDKKRLLDQVGRKKNITSRSWLIEKIRSG